MFYNGKASYHDHVDADYYISIIAITADHQLDQNIKALYYDKACIMINRFK